MPQRFVSRVEIGAALAKRKRLGDWNQTHVLGAPRTARDHKIAENSCGSHVQHDDEDE